MVSSVRRGVASAEHPRPMTLEAWAALDEDVEGELVDGALEEEEVPTFLHEIVVAWLLRNLGPWVRRRRGQVTASEMKIAVGPRRGRKPDVAVFLAGRMPALDNALAYATERGSVVVAAAGNDQAAQLAWPAADPRVISNRLLRNVYAPRSVDTAPVRFISPFATLMRSGYSV